MPNENTVVDAANQLHTELDDTALEQLIGERTKQIELDPGLKDNPYFRPKYEDETMGPLVEIKVLGKQIVQRWNMELYGVICGAKGKDKIERKAVLDSLNISELAVISAVVTTLLSMGVTA